ncbi:MAG: hypothetical protein AVO35_12525 [Candidatus Aegiribacteria sp. MLS_C]|nr:MAG: hypothetical protein AVO35_12525 [Candidatus Aegiribacteria sp. MLS_C]
MGMLDFIRDAGEKLTEMGEEAKLAGRIEKRIIALGVDVKGLDVDVDGEKVVLKGYPASEEDRQKAVQIAGNVRGIARVYDRMTLKGGHTGTGKPAKPVQKKDRPAKPLDKAEKPSRKMMKEPRQGGRKVRPAEPAQRKAKPAKTGRRTP